MTDIFTFEGEVVVRRPARCSPTILRTSDEEFDDEFGDKTLNYRGDSTIPAGCYHAVLVCGSRSQWN